MNRREKILAVVVGALVGVAVLGFGVRAVLIKPLKDIDKKTSGLRERLNKVLAERRAFFEAEDEVKKFAQRTFDTDLDKASTLPPPHPQRGQADPRRDQRAPLEQGPRPLDRPPLLPV